MNIIGSKLIRIDGKYLTFQKQVRGGYDYIVMDNNFHNVAYFLESGIRFNKDHLYIAIRDIKRVFG